MLEFFGGNSMRYQPNGVFKIEGVEKSQAVNVAWLLAS